MHILPCHLNVAVFEGSPLTRCAECNITLCLFTDEPTKRLNTSEMYEKLKVAFLSVQAEKVYLRDLMLNEFIHTKEKKQLQNMDDIIKIKRCVKFVICVKCIIWYYASDKCMEVLFINLLV